MSLVLKYRKPVKEILLAEEHTKHALPWLQNTRKHYMNWKGEFLKHWEAPPKSAYDRPIKKINKNLWEDTRSIWPKK